MHTVLLIDDAMFMRTMIRNILIPEGYQIVGEASNGEDGISLYQKLRPDFVLLDITMEDMSGIEVLRTIRSLDSSANVIICSAMGQDFFIREAIEAGARDFLIKPFKADDLLDVVHRVMLS